MQANIQVAISISAQNKILITINEEKNSQKYL
jgi:hypothetical protein